MMEKPTARTFTFIVRLWSELIEPDQTEWRGYLRCVQTDELIYIQTLHELTRGVALVVGERPFPDQSSHKYYSDSRRV